MDFFAYLTGYRKGVAEGGGSGGGSVEREPGYRRAIFFDISTHDGTPVKVSDKLFTAEDVRFGYLVIGGASDNTLIRVIHEDDGVLQVDSGMVAVGFVNNSQKQIAFISIDAKTAEAVGFEGAGMYLINTISDIGNAGIVFPA